MGIFSTVGKSLIRPYTQLYKDLNKSAKNIKGSIDQVKKHENEAPEVEYIHADDGGQAFKILCEKGGWTEDELKKQHITVRRAKWVFMFGAIIAVILFFAFGLTSSSVLFTLISTGFSAVATALFAARCIQYAIFQTQLEERYLITFNEFMARDDFWKRLFS